MYKDSMWCILGLTQPHVADAKGGRGKEIAKTTEKDKTSFKSSQDSPWLKIFP